MLPSNRKKPVNSNQLTGFYMRATLATNGLKQTKGIYTGGNIWGQQQKTWFRIECFQGLQEKPNSFNPFKTNLPVI